MEMWKRRGPDAADMGSTGSMLEGRLVRRRTKDRVGTVRGGGGVVVGTRRLLLLLGRGIVVNIGRLALRGVGGPLRRARSLLLVVRHRAVARSWALAGAHGRGRRWSRAADDGFESRPYFDVGDIILHY
jgi:hypothetical protein